MVRQQEKDKAIELFLAHAVSGYASQPRAANDDFWEKDNATGVMVPRSGGPKWVAEMSIKTMSHIIEELEGMVAANEPEGQNEDIPGSTEELNGAAGDSGSELLESGEIPADNVGEGTNQAEKSSVGGISEEANSGSVSGRLEALRESIAPGAI